MNNFNYNFTDKQVIEIYKNCDVNKLPQDMNGEVVAKMQSLQERLCVNNLKQK